MIPARRSGPPAVAAADRAGQLRARPAVLSNAEMTALEMIGRRMTNAPIARRMSLSEATI